MRKAMRVMALKRRAKKHYLAYRDAPSRGGNHMTNVITGGALDYHATKFNETLDQLAALGEDVPSERLPITGS